MPVVTGMLFGGGEEEGLKSHPMFCNRGACAGGNVHRADGPRGMEV